MRKLLIMLMVSVLALSVLVGCEGSKNVENNKPEGDKTAVEEKDINDFVTIKEVVNKEDVSPNGDKVKYIYEVPIINIDKPEAKKINDTFLDLEKDQERRIGDGQSLTLLIKSKAFLNDGIISGVMEIKKPGPCGIYAANYDMKNDKEISTKELLKKYKFDSKKLIEEINKQVKKNESKPDGEKDFYGIDHFADTVITNTYPPNDQLKKLEEMKDKTKEEKEKYVIENIDKINVYINNDGKLVFIHRGVLEDREFVIE